MALKLGDRIVSMFAEGKYQVVVDSCITLQQLLEGDGVAIVTPVPLILLGHRFTSHGELEGLREEARQLPQYLLQRYIACSCYRLGRFNQCSQQSVHPLNKFASTLMLHRAMGKESLMSAGVASDLRCLLMANAAQLSGVERLALRHNWALCLALSRNFDEASAVLSEALKESYLICTDTDEEGRAPEPPAKRRQLSRIQSDSSGGGFTFLNALFDEQTRRRQPLLDHIVFLIGAVEASRGRMNQATVFLQNTSNRLALEFLNRDRGLPFARGLYFAGAFIESLAALEGMDCPLSWNLRGCIKVCSGDVSDGEQCFKRAVRMGMKGDVPGRYSAAVLWNLHHLYQIKSVRASQRTKLLLLLLDTIRQYPVACLSAVSVMYELANCYADQGKFVDAVRIYEEVIQGCPDEISEELLTFTGLRLYVNYAFALLKTHQPSIALTAVEKALSQFPNDPQLRQLKSEALVCLNRVDEDILLLTEGNMMNHALALLMLGRPMEALPYMRAENERNPFHTETCFNYTLLLYQLHRVLEACVTWMTHRNIDHAQSPIEFQRLAKESQAKLNAELAPPTQISLARSVSNNQLILMDAMIFHNFNQLLVKDEAAVRRKLERMESIYK